MAIETIRPKKDDILKCVARFRDIEPVTSGLPDMAVEGFHRSFYNVVGFVQQPDGEEAFSPIGDATKPRVSHLAPGFGLAYVAAKPGQGVMMHTHDTNETFIVIEGTWKFEWEGDEGDEGVVLEEKDVVSFPTNVHRRFECVSARPGDEEGTILVVVGGDTPAAEFSPESVERMKAAGTWPEAAA